MAGAWWQPAQVYSRGLPTRTGTDPPREKISENVAELDLELAMRTALDPSMTAARVAREWQTEGDEKTANETLDDPDRILKDGEVETLHQQLADLQDEACFDRARNIQAGLLPPATAERRRWPRCGPGNMTRRGPNCTSRGAAAMLTPVGLLSTTAATRKRPGPRKVTTRPWTRA